MSTDRWWFFQIASRQAPSALRIQFAVFLCFYVLMYGLPGIADLLINRSVYLNWYTGSETVFAVSSSAAVFVLLWYLCRVEGGGWRDFWDSRFLGNLVCLLLVFGVLWVGDRGVEAAFARLQDYCPAVRAYCSQPSPLQPPDWYYLIPATLAYTAVEEAVLRGYVMTRARQAGLGLAAAVLISAGIDGLTHAAWGLDRLAESLVLGAALAAIYARWGGLAGFILGRAIWECWPALARLG